MEKANQNDQRDDLFKAATHASETPARTGIPASPYPRTDKFVGHPWPTENNTLGSEFHPRTKDHPTSKHRFLKKLLGRSANSPSFETKEASSHSPIGDSKKQVMGNIQQGNAVFDSSAKQGTRGSSSNELNSPSSTSSCHNTKHDGNHSDRHCDPTPCCKSILPPPPPPPTIVANGDTRPAAKVMYPGSVTSPNRPEVVNWQLIAENLQRELEHSKGRIQKLEREVDKLQSVLDQQLVDTWVQNVSQSPTALMSATLTNNDVPQSVAAHLAASATSDKVHQLTGMGYSQESASSASAGTACPPAAALLLRKRLGVSGEPIQVTQELKYYEKDKQSRLQIREAFRSNDFLMNLDAVQLQEIVSCMHERTVQAGCFIIREGDYGDHLYVGAAGEFEVYKGGERLCTMPAGRCFGEMALLYNCKRTASVKALVDARVWVLERNCFQAIMVKTGMERINELKAFLLSVPLLKDLPPNRILRIADALEAQYHAAGDCIIRQGELADSFFLIQSGEVEVTISQSSESSEVKEVRVRQLTRGDYFGEKALLGEGRRTANVYATTDVYVHCLYRKDFLELIGDIQELKTRSYFEEELSSSSRPQMKPMSDDPDHHNRPLDLGDNSGVVTGSSLPSLVSGKRARYYIPGLSDRQPALTKIAFSDLVHICVLGVGGFGRVDLVTSVHDRQKAYAMKRMQKQHIVQTKQQEHVHLEKVILASVDCPFICKLYGSYRDTKYVYLLLEACLGGELWTILRDSRQLDERTVKFCLACSIEALDYLHRHGIIYRDLKPENMLVTASGYIKLCDFGFAKYIGLGQKTWTFCGTPEYVAPEVILNKGHDFAADYWSLGILTYELLIGTPPFQAQEPIKIYMKTLKGIEALGLAQNKYISMKALQFIRHLCRRNPSERLGVGKHGIQEIRSHKLFQGFDWAAIGKQTMPTPFNVRLNGPLDYSNFDRFTMDEQDAPEEHSGWDVDF